MKTADEIIAFLNSDHVTAQLTDKPAALHGGLTKIEAKDCLLTGLAEVTGDDDPFIDIFRRAALEEFGPMPETDPGVDCCAS